MNNPNDIPDSYLYQPASDIRHWMEKRGKKVFLMFGFLQLIQGFGRLNRKYISQRLWLMRPCSPPPRKDTNVSNIEVKLTNIQQYFVSS